MPSNFSLSGQQEVPPPPAEPRSITLPKPSEAQLPNGLRIIAAEAHNMPLVTIMVLLRRGGETDPPRLSGLAEMTGKLLTRGTKTRSAPQIADAIESLGGTLDSGASWDYSYVSAGVMSSFASRAMQIVADVTRNPAFADDEIERLRQQLLDELRVALRQPREIAGFVAARAVFGGSAYGHPLAGTPQSVKRIKRGDILQMYRQNWRPENCIVLIAGDLPARDALTLAKRFFADWNVAPGIPGPVAHESEIAASTKRRTIVIDMPEAGQAAAYVARTGIKRTDSDFFTGQVANSVLGGGYSSRLNQEIRIKRGLSYGAGSRLDTRRRAGILTAGAQTKNESAVEVARLVLAELKRLQAETIPPEELTPRKSVLIGTFGRALETTDGLVAQFSDLALNDLPLNRNDTYIQEVQAVSSEDVRRFARERLDDGSASIIIVGDAKEFAEALRKEFRNFEIIPLARLDLNSPALQSRARRSSR